MTIKCLRLVKNSRKVIAPKLVERKVVKDGGMPNDRGIMRSR